MWDLDTERRGKIVDLLSGLYFLRWMNSAYIGRGRLISFLVAWAWSAKGLNDMQAQPQSRLYYID